MTNKRMFSLGDDLQADLSELIDTRLLIQANSGGGKSFCVRRLLEQTHGKVQHLVIDPEGEYASLREKFDYVLAAKDGDTPADPRSASLLAERLLELKASAILDIYELKHHDRIRFVRHFLDTLVNAPKHLWHPVLVVIDEAHVFCPQAGEAESATAVIDICTRGRKRGFCAVLATQRIAKLHKDAAAECNNKLIGRSSLDVDMKRAGDELGFTKNSQPLLRFLKPGEFYAFGPALTREVVKVHIGDVTTSHPKIGGRRKFKAPPPTRHIKAMLPKLADLPAEVEQRETTQRELKTALADTRRKLTEALKAKPVPAAEVRKVDVPVITDKHMKALDKWIAKMTPLARAMAESTELFANAVTEIKTAVLSVQQPVAINAEKMLKNAEPRERAINTEKTNKSNGSDEARISRSSNASAASAFPGRLPAGEKRVLIAVAQSPFGATREKLSQLTTFRRSTRDQYINRLAGQGLVFINRNIIKVSDAGLAALGDSYEPLPTGDALRAYWLSKLPDGERTLLEAIAHVHPKSLQKDELEARVSYKRSTRDQYLNRLAARQLISRDDDGGYSAADALFG